MTAAATQHLGFPPGCKRGCRPGSSVVAAPKGREESGGSRIPPRAAPVAKVADSDADVPVLIWRAEN